MINGTSVATKTAVKVAKVANKTVVKPKAKKDIYTSAQLDTARMTLRKKLNEAKDLNKIAGKLKVDVKKYSKLGEGLQKMNIVNSCIGSVIRKLRGGEIKLTEVNSQAS